MEERTIKLELVMSDGKTKKFLCDFVPQSKRLEYIRKEMALQAEKEEPSQNDYDEIQAEFVASLFDEEEVTKDAILNGMDAQDFPKIYDIIRYRVLGFKREDDEALKKAVADQLLVGQDTTSSNSNLPEQSSQISPE